MLSSTRHYCRLAIRIPALWRIWIWFFRISIRPRGLPTLHEPEWSAARWSRKKPWKSLFPLRQILRNTMRWQRLFRAIPERPPGLVRYSWRNRKSSTFRPLRFWPRSLLSDALSLSDASEILNRLIMAYDPHVFDLIREKFFAAEKKKKEKRLSAKIAAVSVGIVIWLFALSIFSDSKALETVSTCQGSAWWELCSVGKWTTQRGNNAGNLTAEILSGVYVNFSSSLYPQGLCNNYWYNTFSASRTPFDIGNGDWCHSDWITFSFGWIGNFDPVPNKIVGYSEILPHTNGNAAIVRIDYWASVQRLATRVLVIDWWTEIKALPIGNSDFVWYYGWNIRKVSFDWTLLNFYSLDASYNWVQYSTESAPVWMANPEFPPIVDHNTIYTDIEAPAFTYWSNGGYYIFAPFTGTFSALFRLDTGDITGGDASILERLEAFFFGGTVQVPAIPLLAGKYPVGMVEPADNNVATLATNWTQSGNSLVGTSVSFHGIYPDEAVIASFESFQNPNFYFGAYPNVLKKADVNCIYPGFDICRPVNGTNRCTNASAAVDPANTACGVPVNIQPWTYKQSGTGSTWTWSGQNCSWTGCISQWTGSWAIAWLQSFIEYVTNCDSDASGDVSISEAVACVPRAIGRFFSGTFDRISDAFSKTWGLLEELMKTGTKSGSGSELFSFSFYDTAKAGNAFSGETNPIIIASKQWIDGLAESGNILDRMITFLKWALLTILTVSAIAIFFSFRR